MLHCIGTPFPNVAYPLLWVRESHNAYRGGLSDHIADNHITSSNTRTPFNLFLSALHMLMHEECKWDAFFLLD
jgi:hypothetical protein